MGYEIQLGHFLLKTDLSLDPGTQERLVFGYHTKVLCKHTGGRSFRSVGLVIFFPFDNITFAAQSLWDVCGCSVSEEMDEIPGGFS